MIVITSNSNLQVQPEQPLGWSTLRLCSAESQTTGRKVAPGRRRRGPVSLNSSYGNDLVATCGYHLQFFQNNSIIIQ